MIVVASGLSVFIPWVESALNKQCCWVRLDRDPVDAVESGFQKVAAQAISLQVKGESHDDLLAKGEEALRVARIRRQVLIYRTRVDLAIQTLGEVDRDRQTFVTYKELTAGDGLNRVYDLVERGLGVDVDRTISLPRDENADYKDLVKDILENVFVRFVLKMRVVFFQEVRKKECQF